MITLKTLCWSNCFSYGQDNCIDLSGDKVTQIVGFNGTGKSSIPLLLEEVLYNKNSKGMKKASIPNRYSDTDHYDISLDFSIGTDEYTVTVSRKTTIKVILMKNGEDISSHTATNTFANIQSIIGLDFKTFSQLVYQNPTSSLQFLTATDTNRKKFLIDLLSLDKYVKLFETFKDAVKDSNNKVLVISSKLSTVENWLKDSSKYDTGIYMFPVEVPSKDEHAVSELKSTQKDLDNILSTNRKISNNNELKNQLAKVDLKQLESIQATETLKYDDIQLKIGSLSSTVAQCKTHLNKLKSLGNSCPTCEQSIPEDFKTGLMTETSMLGKASIASLKILEEELQNIKANNAEYAKKKQGQEHWESIYRGIDNNLPSTLLDKGTLSTKISELTTRIDKVNSSIKEAEQYNKLADTNNSKMAVIQEQKEQFLAQVALLTSELTELKEIDSTLEVLKKTFSTNGLLAYKIESLVKSLEDLTNEYLVELADGRFSIEFVVTNDKLNVELNDSGHLISVEDLSSGEMARVNTATLLAVRSLMSSISKSRLNILFLDEVINVLDYEGREKLVEILLQESGLNTFIVSHGWAHPLLSKLNVIKEDNISRVENG